MYEIETKSKLTGWQLNCVRRKSKRRKWKQWEKSRNKAKAKLSNWSLIKSEEKTETKWKQSLGIELWREGAGVPIPVTFPPIETIAMCFVFLKWFLCIFSTKNYPIEKKTTQGKKNKSLAQAHPQRNMPIVLFVCCLFSDEGEDHKENDDGHDDEDSYIWWGGWGKRWWRWLR